MKAKGWGRIVNQSSVGVYYDIGKFCIPHPSGPPSASPACTAREALADSGVTVNGIAPGMMFTEAHLSRFPDEESARTYVVGFAEQNIPMGRVGTPEDLAGALLFLVSDAALLCDGPYPDGGRGLDEPHLILREERLPRRLGSCLRRSEKGVPDPRGRRRARYAGYPVHDRGGCLGLELPGPKKEQATVSDGVRFDHFGSEMAGPRFWDEVRWLQSLGPISYVENYGGYWLATSYEVVLRSPRIGAGFPQRRASRSIARRKR